MMLRLGFQELRGNALCRLLKIFLLQSEEEISGFLTWKSGSLHGNASDTESSGSNLLLRGGKHRTPPSRRPALHPSTGDKFIHASSVTIFTCCRGGKRMRLMEAELIKKNG